MSRNSNYDLIGCAYNMPAAYTKNEFTSCEGELQDVVGVYTSAGQSKCNIFLQFNPICLSDARLTAFHSIHLVRTPVVSTRHHTPLATPHPRILQLRYLLIGSAIWDHHRIFCESGDAANRCLGI